MLFNSLEFAIFIPIVFVLYWFVFNHNIKQQNSYILLVSYIFYGWWDYRFLGLLFLSTFIDFSVGRYLQYKYQKSTRKLLLAISLFSNIGILAFFKYCNFFINNFVDGFSFFGKSINISTLNIILPVGISFYTFQTLSYTIDVYRKKIIATNDFISFAAYVSFFPQLVAGPIERASRLLPQFQIKRFFDYSLAVDGCKQILWGFFKKLVIADNCAYFADMFFDHHEMYQGSSLLLGAFFFTIQIYGDFSGYSDIAIGTARLFGFDLMKNFSYPYFSRDIAEFWRRWHISLSTWFRDYVYIPLGGSKVSPYLNVRNVIIVFVVSGFWHGAKWNFIIWGLLNAILFIPLLLSSRNRQHLDIVAKGKYFPSLTEIVKMFSTFSLVMLLWIFFRAENIQSASLIMAKILSPSLLTFPQFTNMGMAFTTIILIVFFMTLEWIGRTENFAIEIIFSNSSKWLRWSFYSFIIALIGLYMQTDNSPFIYFQF